MPDSSATTLSRALKHLPALLWMSFIFYLSSQPGSAFSAKRGSWLKMVLDNFAEIDGDKIIHFALYFILAASYSISIKNHRWVIVVMCFLFGLSDEWHQSFVSGRNSDVFDLLADTLGGLACVLFLKKFKTL